MKHIVEKRIGTIDAIGYLINKKIINNNEKIETILYHLQKEFPNQNYTYANLIKTIKRNINFLNTHKLEKNVIVDLRRLEEEYYKIDYTIYYGC